MKTKKIIKYVVGSLRGNRRQVEFDTRDDALLYMKQVRWPAYLERVEAKITRLKLIKE